MTEKQPSAEVMALLHKIRTTDGRAKFVYSDREGLASLDDFAARSRREAIAECADVCRSLGQYSGRNVQPAIEQIADQIAALNESVGLTLHIEKELYSGIEMTEEEKAVLRKYLPWDLPVERLEAMARAMYEHGPMFKNTGLAWDAFPDYLADRRAVYLADAITSYRADPLFKELWRERLDAERS